MKTSKKFPEWHSRFTRQNKPYSILFTALAPWPVQSISCYVCEFVPLLGCWFVYITVWTEDKTKTPFSMENQKMLFKNKLGFGV